jgi:hypothetical protein
MASRYYGIAIKKLKNSKKLVPFYLSWVEIKI